MNQRADGAPPHVLALPGDPSDARSARQLVTRAMRDLAPEAAQETVDLAVLLTSELTSNAILHARTPFTVSVERADGVVRVSVHDGSPVMPSRRRYSITASTGRGVAMLQDLATRTGVEPEAGGKTVWFELEVDPSAQAASEHEQGVG